MCLMDTTPDIPAIQQALQEASLDGWLFANFRGSDSIAFKVLRLPQSSSGTRRWFYFVPARGDPQKIVHAIEPKMLDPLPGAKTVYLSWRSLHDSLLQSLEGCQRVALQYSPQNDVPTVSRVDAGTVELVRSFGVEVVSSADLVQRFEATLDDTQLEGHRRSAGHLRRLVDEVFAEVAKDLRAGRGVSERSLLDFALRYLEESGLVTDHAPILAVNEHAADPHFEVPERDSAPVRAGDLLLFDVWAKESSPRSIYADITWCAFVGAEPPPKILEVFDVVRRARDAALDRCDEAFRSGSPLRGFEVDRAARDVIEKAGYGDRYLHRTGHSIHEETHGNGANMDDLETHDTRLIIPRTLFSVEPGIYLSGDFGIRSEVDVFHAGNQAEVTGGRQDELVRIVP